jgi:peptidoglycan L-alanyl-D-glutamate endopeptidase CwlK
VFRLSARSLSNIAGVDPDMIRIAKRAIEITLVDFGYGNLGGLRTAEEQHALYTSGKSRADGHTRRSKHQDGLAIDFYAYVGGAASWDRTHLAMVAAAHLQAAAELGIPVRWGGLWKSRKGGIFGWDMPHIEKVI